MMQTIREGKAILAVSTEKKISKKLPVFYNPVMKTNRDLSIAVIRAWEKEQLQIADVFAATGVRSIRFLKELPKKKIKNISMNDYNKNAIRHMKENLKRNKLDKDKRMMVTNDEADIFLLESTGFDYIDIDPFGTPVPFLDAACKRLSRDSILAVTATDTSALAGAVPKACRRKYDAFPIRCPIMHEIGLRILIRKCQVIAAQYDKALTPLLSYFKDHYMRIFFHCKKGRSRADAILQQQGIIEYEEKNVGPIWKGTLSNAEFIQKMETEQEESAAFLELIKKEAAIQTVGFYDIHAFCKKYHLAIPRTAALMDAIKKAGFLVARTHFSDVGIRTTIGEEELIQIIKLSQRPSDFRNHAGFNILKNSDFRF